jgi:hypothetical protein
MSRHGVKLRDAKTQSLLSWSFQSRTGDEIVTKSQCKGVLVFQNGDELLSSFK